MPTKIVVERKKKRTQEKTIVALKILEVRKLLSKVGNFKYVPESWTMNCMYEVTDMHGVQMIYFFSYHTRKSQNVV